MSGTTPYREQYSEEVDRVNTVGTAPDAPFKLVAVGPGTAAALTRHLDTRRPFNDPAFENGYRAAVARCIEIALREEER
jgi:hypothetical protein